MARRKTESDLDAFHAKLDELKLSFFREHYPDVVQRAAQQQWDHLAVLEQLVDGEANRRRDRSVERRIRLARFPVKKTLESFDWTWPKKDQPAAGHEPVPAADPEMVHDVDWSMSNRSRQVSQGSIRFRFRHSANPRRPSPTLRSGQTMLVLGEGGWRTWQVSVSTGQITTRGSSSRRVAATATSCQTTGPCWPTPAVR